MADLTDQTPAPRLGAALIIGADAAICVHVHTDPAGIAAIDARLRELGDQAGDAETVPVIAVYGSTRSALADQEELDIPAAAVDGLAAMALGVNR